MRPARVLLTLAAGFGFVCLLLAISSTVLGTRVLLFESGSMSPSMPAGSLALTRPVAGPELTVGDVVSVIAADGQRVTHRVSHVATAPDGRAVLTLRGDANATPDAEPYLVARADKVVIHVPHLGHPIAWLGSPLGLVLLAAGGCGMWLGAVRRRRPAGRRRALAVVAVPTAVVVALATTSTGAWFSDSGTVRSGGSTHAVLPPASTGCSSALLAGTVSWPADPRYDYEVVLRRVSGAAVISTRSVTGGGSSITYTGLVSFGSPIGLGTFDYQVEIRSYLAGAPTWRSASVRTYQYLRVLVVAILGATVSCTT